MLQAIHHRLDQPWCRLVTIVGGHGGDQARLAEVIARQRRAQYTDGVWVIALTAFDVGNADPSQALAAHIAAVLDLPLAAPGQPLMQLLAHLQWKQMLLVLVDFHQVGGGVEVVVDIVQSCEGVQLLVTSEEALEIRAEWLIA